MTATLLAYAGGVLHRSPASTAPVSAAPSARSRIRRAGTCAATVCSTRATARSAGSGIGVVASWARPATVVQASTATGRRRRTTSGATSATDSASPAGPARPAPGSTVSTPRTAATVRSRRAGSPVIHRCARTASEAAT
ncbi:hypothetical protein [Actinoplanes sp. NPDC051494]|uniref:hypothetical protein n=1 Tax=Actinoplanes sp. NPDC051494 TaxID=3363907 RepID=UPI0037BC0F26